jgi:hypothetical protein
MSHGTSNLASGRFFSAINNLTSPSSFLGIPMFSTLVEETKPEKDSFSEENENYAKGDNESKKKFDPELSPGNEEAPDDF